jgi:hypothetical protein
LTWFEGAIEIKGHFHGDAHRELGAVAEDLRANLQGDHGERYTGVGGVAQFACHRRQFNAK